MICATPDKWKRTVGQAQAPHQERASKCPESKFESIPLHYRSGTRSIEGSSKLNQTKVCGKATHALPSAHTQLRARQLFKHKMKLSNEVGNGRLLAVTVVDVAHTCNDSDLAVYEHKGKDTFVHGVGWRDSNDCTPPREISMYGLHVWNKTL